MCSLLHSLPFLLVYLCVNVGPQGLLTTTLWGLLAAAWHAPFHNPPPCWVRQPPPCRKSSPPLLPVWMNVSSLSPWLSDFHTVQFSVSSSCFLFSNCCCPSFGRERRHSVSTYASILAGNPEFIFKHQIISLAVPSVYNIIYKYCSEP